jgi:hypothetical protein
MEGMIDASETKNDKLRFESICDQKVDLRDPRPQIPGRFHRMQTNTKVQAKHILLTLDSRLIRIQS